MRKIYLKEDSIRSVLNNRLLPKFLFNAVKKHETSLGDNSAFPSGGDYPFDYTILKERYTEVCDAIEELGLDSLDEDYLMSELSESVKLCKDMETPIRDTLEKVCENAVNRLFAIPEDMIDLRLKLVDKVKFKKAVRLRPESSEDSEYSFEDLADLELSNRAVEKRRFTNSLIQGASYTYANILGLYVEDIDRINRDLIPLYRKITTINDFLLFTRKESISDKNPMQGSYVEVHLAIGGGDGKSSVKAQGIIFPLLLQETIKGLFELFSSHGLPSDLLKAQYIIRKADFVLAEPWDMRFGVILWNKIFGGVEDTNMIPYIFSALISMDTDTFNESVKEILAHTRKGEGILDELMQQAEYDNGYQQFTNRINAKNIDKSLIKDSYFTGADENGFELDSDTSEGDVIAEGEDADVMGQYEAEPQKSIEYYQQLVKSATVDNIDFIDGKVNGAAEDVIVTINGEIIPRALILLMVQPVKIRISVEERMQMNQVHIILNDAIQRLGLAPKIYKKLIYTFGPIYSGEGRRINKEHIAKVYAKLAQDPDLFVHHDDMCYIAMVNNAVQEVFKPNKKLITEGWSKDKRTIINRTADIIRKNVIGIDIYSAYEYENKIADQFFHGSMSGNGKIRKYEPMVAKILTKELGWPNNPTHSEEIQLLKDILLYMWNFQIRQGIKPSAICNFDKMVIMDDFNTLVSRYKPLLDELEANGQSIKDFSESEYEIIPIEDFATANKYGNYSFPGKDGEYGRLCYTQSNGTWNSYTNYGKNKCFLCLNKNAWQKWGDGEFPEDDDKTPYDEYGLSMIWVFINPKGEMVYSNTRWNHHRDERIPRAGYGGIGTDKSFDVSSLEGVLNKSFEDAFGVIGIDYKDYADLVNEKLERINNGTRSIADEFGTNNTDDCGFGEVHNRNGFCVIRVGDKFNFLKEENGQWSLLSPNFWEDWDDESISKFLERCPRALARVEGENGLFNIIDVNGEMMLPENSWCHQIDAVTGLVRLNIWNTYNFLTADNGGRVLFNEWVSWYSYANNLNSFIVIKTDGTMAYFDFETNSLISINEFLEANPEVRDLVKVENTEIGLIAKFEGFENLMKDGKFSNYWCDEIIPLGDNFYKVEIDSCYCNVMDSNGELIWKHPMQDWFTEVYEEDGKDGYFWVKKDGLGNLMDSKGNLLLDTFNTDNWVVERDKFDFGNVKLWDFLTDGQKHLIMNEDFLPIGKKKYDQILVDSLANGMDIMKLSSDGKWSLMDSNSMQIQDTDFCFIGNFNYGYAPVMLDNGASNYVSISNIVQPICQEWYERTYPFKKVDVGGTPMLFGEVKDNNGRYNFVDDNGYAVLPNSYEYIEIGSNGTCVVNEKSHANIFRLDTREMIYKAPFEEWFSTIVINFQDDNKLAIVKKGEYYNFLTFDGNLLFNNSNITQLSNEIWRDEITAIVTNEDGRCNIINLHSGKIASEEWFYDYETITSDIIKCYFNPNENSNVYYSKSRGEMFVAQSKAELHTFDDVQDDTPLGEYLKNVFGENVDINAFIEGKLYKITTYKHDGNEKVQNLVGIVDGRPKYLLPTWVAFVSRPLGNLCSCAYKEDRTKRNIFNLSTLSYIFDKPISEITIERDEGLFYVSDDNRENIVDINGNLLFGDEWPVSYNHCRNNNGEYYDNLYRAQFQDGKFNILNTETHRYLSKDRYDFIDVEKGNTSKLTTIVGIENPNDDFGWGNRHCKYNFLNEEGELMMNEWCTALFVYNDYYMMPLYKDESLFTWNYYNRMTGEPMSDAHIKYGQLIQKNGKYNYIATPNLDLLLPEWADSATEFDENNFSVATVDNKRYTVAIDSQSYPVIMREEEGNQ